MCVAGSRYLSDEFAVFVLIGILAMQHTPQRDQAEQRQGGQSRPGKKGALWPHLVPQNARDHAGQKDHHPRHQVQHAKGRAA